MPTVADAQYALAAELDAAGIGTPSLDARLLVSAATGRSHERLIADPSHALSPGECDALDRHKTRRLKREPVSRILGSREFWGRDFLLSPATLDPRPDTETLIEAVLKDLRDFDREGQPLSILDLGTGSGVLIITLLAELGRAEGLGTDISVEALRTARANAARHGVSSRVGFVATDWWNGIEGTFDIVVANPPYIPTDTITDLSPEVRQFDPWVALDGGADGLDAYRQILHGLAPRISDNALIALEVGHDQSDIVAELLARSFAGSHALKLQKIDDLAGQPRCVLFRLSTVK